MTLCNSCGTEVPASRKECLTCGAFSGYPNVRAADAEAERTELGSRYIEAIARARENKSEVKLYSFEECLRVSTSVIATSVEVLREFAANSKFIYTTYGLSVQGQSRTPADPQDDSLRRMVDAYLFGEYGSEIRYAALSLDGSGLSNYGNYFVSLREIAIQSRSSLLDENSFKFFEDYAATSAFKIPPGHRCVWAERTKLGVIKCAEKLLDASSSNLFPDILLHNGASRQEDDFIEVHIYGPITVGAIDLVRVGPKTKRSDEVAVLKVIKELLEKQGKKWIDNA